MFQVSRGVGKTFGLLYDGQECQYWNQVSQSFAIRRYRRYGITSRLYSRGKNLICRIFYIIYVYLIEINIKDYCIYNTYNLFTWIIGEGGLHKFSQPLLYWHRSRDEGNLHFESYVVFIWKILYSWYGFNCIIYAR